MGYKEKYIEKQLESAKAITNGVIEGQTEMAGGHKHRYAVTFIDDLSKFVGLTTEDGKGPHTHYISASIYDVVNGEQANISAGNPVVVEVSEKNATANLLNVLEFYNLKEITLISAPDYYDGHVHTLVLRYAGVQIDKMGRKIQASLFTEGLRKSGGSMKNS